MDMSKFREFWQIESGMRCPVCKGEDIKSITGKDGIPVGECRHCKTQFRSYGFSWLELGLTLLTIVLVEALMVKVFIPNNINRYATLTVMILLVIVLRELLAFVVYLLFGKTKVKILKEKHKNKGEKNA